MSTYILLLTLTADGRQRMLDDGASLQRAEDAISIPGVEVLGLYGVLGECDFVSIVEAPDNESAAAFSLELGVRAGAHIATLPAIPIARFETGPSQLSAATALESGADAEASESEERPLDGRAQRLRRHGQQRADSIRR